MTIRLPLILALATFAAPVLAQEVLRGPGSSDIYQVDAHTIEVVSNLGEPRGFWCGAAHYARHNHMDWSTQIYVVTAPGPTSHTESGEGVKFTTDPSAAGITPGAESETLEPGSWMTVTEANRGCNEIDNPRNN